MPTENTSLKITTPAGDSNTTNEMVVEKINNYQRTLLIVTGILLALLVVIAVTGTSGIYFYYVLFSFLVLVFVGSVRFVLVRFFQSSSRVQ